MDTGYNVGLFFKLLRWIKRLDALDVFVSRVNPPEDYKYKLLSYLVILFYPCTLFELKKKKSTKSVLLFKVAVSILSIRVSFCINA